MAKFMKGTKARPRRNPARTGSQVRAADSVRATAVASPEALGSAAAIVGVGASAGGLEAFTALLKELPADSGLALVFAQHLAPAHESMLAEILQRATSMPVAEARDESPLEPNRVYVLPPACSIVLRDGRLRLTPRAEGQHHPIDHLFESLAASEGHRAIGVVLSGTASDGTAGLAAIKAAGGITFAQDETAMHDGMPRSAIAAGCVDFVLPPASIARELLRIARHPYVAQADTDFSADQDIDQVLDILHRGSGVDFTQYKSNTLRRRILRRIVLQKLASFAEYAHFLRENPREGEALYQDILIGVTDFFRNPEAFEALKTKVFPRIFKDRGRKDPVRVWVLGCSTGEEAYSLAIVLAEYASEAASVAPLTVYATDLNTIGIEKSRTGFYPKSIAQDISAQRLRQFFVESAGSYRVTKAIRNMCIFARHNVLTDPPLSRMDLVSCRNVMIYMEPALQRKLLPVLHYALRPEGFLFLGPSETIGASRALFELEDSKHKIYSKKPGTVRLEQSFPVGPYTPLSLERPEHWRGAPKVYAPDASREADRQLLARYVPAGVLVDDEGEVLQFRGDTGLYLAPAPGKASLNVLKMAREGLLVSLRGLLRRARREESPVREEGVRIKSNGGHHDVTLCVIPLGRSQTSGRCYWIMFESPVRARVVGARDGRGGKRPGAAAEEAAARREADKHINRLTQELSATREYLQSVIEQQEAANEELQSANEEVQSANEELQSINEELETSREEIQSSNEELTTVNQELQNSNEELSRLNSDLINLFSSVQMAIVMVWRDLRIRRFTPMAEKLFNLISTDVGRAIGDIKLNFNVSDLPRQLSEVIDTGTTRELEVQGEDGRWYLLRLRPYRLVDNQIDGAVVALLDIESVKQNRAVLERQARLLEQSHEAVFVHKMDGSIEYWNHGAELLYGFTKEEALGNLTQQLLNKDTGTHAALNEALKREGCWTGELVHRTKDGPEIVVDSIQVALSEGGRELVLETNRDVTERKRLEEALRRRVEELGVADRHKNEFLAVLAHELRNPLAPLRNAVEIMRTVPAGDPRGVRANELVERQVATLARLVDDLLDTARINRGQVQLRRETLELQPVLARAIETTRSMIEARRHRLSVGTPVAPVIVDGDATRLEQVFANLLNNAAKYTPEGGEISVTMDVAPAEAAGAASQVAVRVRDTGMGIAPDMLPQVFELFTQADRSLAHSQGGLGIGLSLVRSLVQLQGGRVTAHSEGLGRGSEFVVYLPLRSAGHQEEPAKKRADLRAVTQAAPRTAKAPD